MEISTLKRPSSCPDPHSAKALRSTLIMQPQSGSPLLMLSLDENDCRLYNPKEDQVYETKGNFSGYRFLGSSGKWFLVIDSLANLYIVDVFSDEKISLPRLESMKGEFFKIEHLGDKEFKHTVIGSSMSRVVTVEKVRGHLWVDEKNGDYVVVWHFVGIVDHLAVCKKGDDHYREIPTVDNVPAMINKYRDVVLKGYRLYLLSKCKIIRMLDLSGQDGGFKDVNPTGFIMFGHLHILMTLDERKKWQGYNRSSHDNIAITTSRDILLVHTTLFESPVDRHRIFDVYKRDPKDRNMVTLNAYPTKVHSLGDEALFLDLGITVPADRTLGIEPNSIYFTRDDRVYPYTNAFSCLDICVYNLATKKTRSFPDLFMLKLKDAQWFLPS